MSSAPLQLSQIEGFEAAVQDAAQVGDSQGQQQGHQAQDAEGHDVDAAGQHGVEQIEAAHAQQQAQANLKNVAGHNQRGQANQGLPVPGEINGVGHARLVGVDLGRQRQ